MTSGDVVSQVSSSSFTFQPASSVTVCCTTFFATGAWGLRGRGNINTSSSNIPLGAGSENYKHDTMNYWVWGRGGFKFFIDNSSYIYFQSSSGYGGFSGIQTA